MECSNHHSTWIYLEVLWVTDKETLIGHIVDALYKSGKASTVLVKCSPESVFQLQPGAVATSPGNQSSAEDTYIIDLMRYSCTAASAGRVFAKLDRPPALRRVLYVALHEKQVGKRTLDD